jgi:hypothetical protein
MKLFKDLLKGPPREVALLKRLFYSEDFSIESGGGKGV